jgi:hypothetical protein
LPYTQATLSTLKQSLADRHDSGVLPTSSATLSFWTRLFNKGVEYCADRLRLEKSTTLTTVSGTIALPDDFLIMNRVLNSSNNDLYMTDQNDAPNHTAGYYWITGNQTDGFALNTTQDTTYTVYYSFKPVPLVTDADICIIPDPEAVVAYAYGSLRRSETDPIEDADKSFQECDSRLVELQSASNINNNFTGFTYA